jgi:hypothetical protein
MILRLLQEISKFIGAYSSRDTNKLNKGKHMESRKFQAEIGLNKRYIGGRAFIILGNLQALDDIDFDREHCHAEINANVEHFLDRKVRTNRNRLVIQFEADIVPYYKPREGIYGQTLTKIRKIKSLGRA